MDLHLPGFKCYRNACRYMIIKAVCLVKYALSDRINFMRFNVDDGIWISFSHICNIVFAGFYVLPENLPYYNDTILPRINSQLIEVCKPSVLLGDFNAKLLYHNTIN